MTNALRLYLSYISISFRGQMQHRASFMMLTTGHFLLTGIEFLGIWAMFDRFGSLRGWTLPEVAFLYGLVNTSFSVADAMCRGFKEVGVMIKSGDFDRLLIRPRSTVLQLLGYELQLRRFGRLIQALAVFLWAASVLHIDWTAPKILLLMGTVTGGVCLFVGLTVLQSMMSFWTTESLEIMNIMTYGGVETSQYPLSIYKPWLRNFFTLVIPLSCVTYFPTLALLEHPDPLGTSLIFQWTSPLIGFGFLLASIWAWQWGIRQYRSTGS